MYVIDLEGNEFALQATSTNDGGTNGNQSFKAVIPSSDVNKEFINDIREMWTVVDHDDIEHRIIFCEKRGKGDRLVVEITGRPLFFDDMGSQRVERRVDQHFTAQAFFNFVFNEPDYQGNTSGYAFVVNGSFSAIQWEGLGEGETRLEMFKKGIDRYKCEFRRVGKTIYLETLIGNDTNQQYSHKLNASNIVQEVDANELYTYAKGYGDYGDGEGGEDWRDAKLIREYVSPLASIIGYKHAPPIMNGNITTRTQMDNQLKTLVDESLKFSVTADIHDLRKQGYPIGQAQLGDRVFLTDPRIDLNEEVRISHMSITRNWKGDILDVKYTFGTDGVAKRRQSTLRSTVKNITSLMEGKLKLPYSVLDDAVINATKLLHSALTELQVPPNGGLLAVDPDNPNNLVAFTSKGIGISSDGGATFPNAITGLGLNVNYVYTGTMLADHIAGGILAALNGNTVFNLNSGKLEMVNANFELGGGALIQFTSTGNRLRYTRNNRHSGIAFGTSINDTYGFVAMGATNVNQPFSITDEAGFSGFIANPFARESEDGIQNSVIGRRFHVRDKAISFSRGFLFKTDSDPYFAPMNTGSHSYDLGRPNNRWSGTYLRSNPDVSSDRKLKTDIHPIDLEFAEAFLMIEAKRYRKKLTNADLNEGIKGMNPYEFGFIAQDVEKIFEGKDMRFESLVSTDGGGSKSMQYGQVSAIHHFLIQKLYSRMERLENAAGL